MDERPRTYTIEELEQESGFDRRTIAYYVQEGLLPKIGRRGPRTRYPQLFLDRLLFIKRIRDLQDQGRTGTVTLAEIRELLEDMPDDELADVAAGDVPVEAAIAEDPGLEAMGMPTRPGWEVPRARARFPLDGLPSRMVEAVSRRAARMMAHESSPPPPAAAPPERDGEAEPNSTMHYLQSPDAAESCIIGAGPPSSEQIGRLLDRLQESTRLRRRDPDRTSEHWTRANVTPNITISARNLDEDEVDLLERVAQMLRQLMRRG